MNVILAWNLLSALPKLVRFHLHKHNCLSNCCDDFPSWIFFQILDISFGWIKCSWLNLGSHDNTIMGLLSDDLLSPEVKEQKIVRALKVEFTWGIGARLCSRVDPWRTAAAVATMNGDPKWCKQWRIKMMKISNVSWPAPWLRNIKKDNKGTE